MDSPKLVLRIIYDAIVKAKPFALWSFAEKSTHKRQINWRKDIQIYLTCTWEPSELRLKDAGKIVHFYA